MIPDLLCLSHFAKHQQEKHYHRIYSIMTAGSGAASNAALCSVTVSNDVLKADIVLEMVLKLVKHKTHQVKVICAGAESKGVLSMSIGGSNICLTQRNAVLRSLVGAALHGAQDHHTAGYCWSGGLFSASASAHGSSVPAALNAASLTQWMSVADQLRKSGKASMGSSDIHSNIIEGQLSQVLQESAFVLPYAASVTLADLDLCVAILASNDDVAANDAAAAAAMIFDNYPAAVQRWMTQVVAVLKQLAAETGVSLEKLALPAPKATVVSPTLFFYGTEDADAVLSALYKDSVKKEGAKTQPKAGKEGDTMKQPQQEEGGKANKKQDKNADGGKKTEKKEDKSTADAAPTFDVTALDIRVGKIIKAWPHETADKLYCEEIDLGNGEIRQIASGLRPFYKQEDLQDRVVLVLCNLKKRTLVGFPSHGMVLCASNADHTAVEFVVPAPDSVIGERVVFDGLDASAVPEPETKVAKKKIFEGIAPDLKTDKVGTVMWKTNAAKTSAGPVTALNKMANASVS